GGPGIGHAPARSAAAGHEGPWRARADAADPGRGHARGGRRIQPHRDPAIRQAAVHLVSASVAGLRMGGAGGGEGVAGPRSPPMTAFWAIAAISHSPNAWKPANLPEIASIMPLP